ncbi:MAG: heavy-metal-associated domain-containing protein [Candidatus Micrarchaeota archaeon]
MEIKLKIGKMHCKACAPNVEDTLKETEGIMDVRVDFESETAVVGFDEAAIGEAQIIKKIEGAGYNAKVER